MLDPLYDLAADAIVFFHKGFGPIFGDDSFFAWALSVMLLVVCVRILIFPLFVRQVKAQRKMQMMQPLIKEIKEKYGHDKARMQQEMVELQREHGNPLLGCLPILLQIPLFISLFSVFNRLKPMEINGQLEWRPRVGLSAEQIEQIAEAKFLGISLSTSFTSSEKFLDFIVADGTHVKIAAVVLIVLMGATTFFTQRQIMARTGPVDPQQAMVQKVLLYGSPLMLAVFGFKFPIAVLLYWLTTNLWSMGQQFFVIKKMPPPKSLAEIKRDAARSGSAGATAIQVSKPKVGVKPQRDTRKPATSTAGASSTTAPRGTRSPHGAAAGKSQTAKTQLGKTQAGKTQGVSKNGTAKDTAISEPSATAAASKSPASKSPASKPSASKPSGNAPAADQTADQTASKQVGAGASAGAGSPGTPRRQPSGASRPGRKRTKNKRPGGRR